jgi:hypothetical protein
MRLAIRLLGLAAATLLGGAAGCIPYTVGSTAQTVPTGQTTAASSYFFVPNAVKRPGDTIATPMAGVDREWRHGLDSRSDIGLRLTSGLGAVVNYKQRVRDYGDNGPAVAYMVGGGIVNAGLHAHLEGTIVASGDERASVMPFGGVRAMQVFPLSAGAVRDLPTLGAFGGVQLGDGAFTLRPELGVFYDQSALHLRSATFIIVPAITIQRARRNSEARIVRPPAMQGARPDRDGRGPGGIVGCVIFQCAAPVARPRPRP